ncbi:putative candidate secreted effector protein [Blumeria hordei DH14]|uniref:Putative candidate secreted effector protein n=1 Tax=Blumeria graminis f. sp. hordei (strain DH14) TaxID=546991 RepID=N1J7W4_BLUG1|nr:putative candidate secreted effector protein [Blumeria hordei DH14]
MKLFTISGAATLFGIFAPAAVMAGFTGRLMLSPQNQHKEFSFLCVDERSYNKEFMVAVVANALQLMRDPHPEQLYPEKFNFLPCAISGPLWYQPLYNYGPDDFIIFNEEREIAGVATCEDQNDGSVWCEECDLTSICSPTYPPNMY